MGPSATGNGRQTMGAIHLVKLVVQCYKDTSGIVSEIPWGYYKSVYTAYYVRISPFVVRREEVKCEMAFSLEIPQLFICSHTCSIWVAQEARFVRSSQLFGQYHSKFYSTAKIHPSNSKNKFGYLKHCLKRKQIRTNLIKKLITEICSRS